MSQVPVVDTKTWAKPVLRITIGQAAFGQYTVAIVPPDGDTEKIVVLHPMAAPPPGGVHVLDQRWTDAASASVLQVFGFATQPGGGGNFAMSANVADDVPGGANAELLLTVQKNSSGAVFSAGIQKA